MSKKAAAKMAAATIGFALLHSALASRQAKNAARTLVGTPSAENGYRLFYSMQAMLSFLALVRFGARLPAKTIYSLSGPPAWILRGGQCLGLLHLYCAASQVGIARMLGLKNFLAWRTGRPALPVPLAQGPEIDASGHLTTGGLYSWSRHPLNFSGIPIFWLTPRMTDKRLVFNLLSTVYFILGSHHEAARLREAYGNAYRRYEKSGVPFFWPNLCKLPRNQQQAFVTGRLPG